MSKAVDNLSVDFFVLVLRFIAISYSRSSKEVGVLMQTRDLHTHSSSGLVSANIAKRIRNRFADTEMLDNEPLASCDPVQS